MNKLPQSRNNDIVVQSLDNEILIYDLKTHQAYNLNETSAIVYQACGSNLTFNELKNKHKLTDDVIHFALNELTANNLIEDYQNNYFSGLSRREVIRKVGLASMIALPIITGLIAPTAAQAQSGTCSRGGVCVAPGNDICAGCAGRTIQTTVYTGPGPNNCTGGSFPRTTNCPAAGTFTEATAYVRVA